MEYIDLGATGLKVSVAGLGCGGSSRLGQSTGSSFQESVSIVRQAFDLGVNFYDTAEVYGTEEIIGAALRNIPRDSMIISTKARVKDHKSNASVFEVVASLDRSLQKLRTDYVDVFHIHAVRPENYQFVFTGYNSNFSHIKQLVIVEWSFPNDVFNYTMKKH